MRADRRGHTADDNSERSNPASGQPDLRDKLVLCKYKKALRLQPGLATGFVGVNAHHPATGVPRIWFSFLRVLFVWFRAVRLCSRAYAEKQAIEFRL